MHKYASKELSEKDTPLTYLLCKLMNEITGQGNNHVIGTRYRNENDNIAPHSDKYGDLVQDSVITSLSFGATRELLFEPIAAGQGARFTIPLENGTLFIMGPRTNAMYTHCVPKSETPTLQRMSLIFRQVKKHVKTDPKPTKSKAKSKATDGTNDDAEAETKPKKHVKPSAKKDKKEEAKAEAKPKKAKQAKP
jgi:hypothetical protein